MPMAMGECLAYSSLQERHKSQVCSLAYEFAVDGHLVLTDFHIDEPSELSHMVLP